MRSKLARIVSLLPIALLFAQVAVASGNPVVRMSTSLGVVELELLPEKAPATVKNFLDYVAIGHYDGTVFHRVIPGFMIQGGGFEPGLRQKDTRDPVRNEADNGLKNLRGTVAMARTLEPHSATAQFFINLADNDFLDHRDKSLRGWGYAVFGRVVKGMDVVDRIAQVPTTSVGPHQDVPRTEVVIQKMQVIGATAAKPR
jgi:cyclophilin family peptidyl-prolyl cis-trans isomerase